MNPLLVDTNILIYAIDADSKFHGKAIDVILGADYILYTTSKNVSEFLVVLTRSKDIKIDAAEALEILESLLMNFKVLYPNKRSFQKFKELIQKYRPRGLWIHDIEIISIALSYGINRILTQNIDDFSRIEEIEIETL